MNSKDIIFTSNAPAPVGAYSQAVRHGHVVYISGQIPIDPKTGQLVATGFADEARMCLENLKAIVEAAGSSMAQLIKVSIFLKDMSNFAELNTIYSAYIPEPFPARAVVEVSELPKSVNIEIEAIAAVA